MKKRIFYLDKLKVLPNDLQSHIETKRKLSELWGDADELDIMGTMYSIVGSKKYEPGVFNRVGRYKLNGKCWYEFLLPDGRYMSHYESDSIHFDFKLNLNKAEERPVTDSHWIMIQTLLTEGIIKNEPRWYFEKIRRNQADSKREIGLYHLEFRKRIAKKVEENEKSKNKTN